MKIQGIGSTYAAQNQLDTAKSSQMGIDDFLKIMTAQLQNQDPMGGSKDPGEYISQMAQFTMLEQLSALTDGINQISMLSEQQISFSLIGKTVKINQGADKEAITGIVDKVRYKNGMAYPVIDGKEYSMGLVEEIGGKSNEL